MRHLFPWTCVLLALLVIPSSYSATNVVLIGEAGAIQFFSPTNITINAGSTILWTNTGSVSHDSTSRSNAASTPLWSSGNGNLANGGTYAFTFTNADTYPYFCFFHRASHPEQTGTVFVVTAPNLPPSVSITNPSNGTIFTAPAIVTIQATASDSDGSVTNVQFLVGATVISNRTITPYAATTGSLTAGGHTLTAIASDNLGAKATNSVSITVNSSPSVAITNPPNNAVFVAPANVTIQATASDSDGSVTNVQFLIGSTVISNRTTAPYAAATNGLLAGSYTLTAIASDNVGAKVTNSISIGVTNAPPSAVTIFNPTFNGNVFVFSFATQAGYTYNAQFTPSLHPTNWLTFTNLPGSGAVVTVTNSSLTTSERYYRVMAQ